MLVTEKIRLQFILTTVGILTFVFFSILGGVYAYLNYSNNLKTYQQIESRFLIFENNEENNEDETQIIWENKFEDARSFAILFDENNSIVALDYNNMLFSETDLIDFAENALEKNLTNDTISNINNIYFMFHSTNEGLVLSAVDRSLEISMMNNTLLLIFTLIVIALLFLSLLVWWLSFYIVKPAEEAFKNQKQFISDASHELKTPLSIISANTTLLKSELKKPSKWLEGIETQNKRITDLVTEMLQLSKLDEGIQDFSNSKFNLSEVLNNCALSFDALTYEAKKTLETEIPENIYCVSDQKSIKKIVSILLDNAIKHSNTKGKIKLTLETQNNKNVITVFNTGCSMKESEKDKIFERFYRGDSSRNRNTGGFGLGLAITKSVADNHKWKISVDCKEKQWTKFILQI